MPEKQIFDADFAARLEKLVWVLRKRIAGGGEGEASGGRKGGLIEFAEHRDYAPGDDLRYVDWNAYARLDKLAVKEYSRDEEAPLLVLLDVSASMAAGGPDKARTAFQAAAALAYVGLASNNPVTLKCVRKGGARTLADLRGKGSLREITGFLGREIPSGGTDLGAALREARAGGRRGMVLLVSDLMDEAGFREELSAVAAKGREVCVLQVLSGSEALPGFEGPVSLVDCETGRSLDLDLDDEALSVFREAAEERVRSLQKFAAGRGIRLVTAAPGAAVEEVVLEVLRHAGWLRLGK